MCSIGDDNLDDLENNKHFPAKPVSKPLSELKCTKCKDSTPCVVLRSKDHYCKGCFLATTTHKFRAALGKHKLIRPGDRVLVVHRGGHASTALLHFIRAGLEMDVHKKLRFHAEVLLVDDQSHLNAEERQKLIESVREECNQFGFSFHIITLSRSIEESASDKSKLKSSESISEDFQEIALRKIIVKEAENMGCRFIFTTDLSQDVASRILSNVALGRGSQISLNAGFVDNRRDSVSILRPLRTFDMKEIIFYNHFHNLKPVIFTGNQRKPLNSVQCLMEKFVTDLQINYPATITTILKTGDRLQTGTSDRICKICQAPIVIDNNELSSEEATLFSHKLSTEPPDYNLHPVERYNTVLESFVGKIDENLCFSCKRYE